MAIEQYGLEKNRPYPPASNVIAVLQRVRTRNLPDRIDAEYLRDAGISESLVQRVLAGLRFLGFVQGEVPSAELDSISTSTDEEYQHILQEQLRRAYADVFAVVDPAKDSQDRILNVFRRYTPASQRGRMVTFFLGMCREAGLEVSDSPRPRSMSESPRTSKAPQARQGSVNKPAGVRGAGSERKDSTEPPHHLPRALDILIHTLPPEGSTMDALQRERWLALASAALDMVYPEPATMNGEGRDRPDQ